jgi:transcriptional regulator
MYIPKHFLQTDRAVAIAFMRRYPFAAIVSVVDGMPVATHLPFHIIEEGDQVLLTAHFAKANPQWKGLKEAMVIFSGPHAYISPEHYKQFDSVPTWNYIAVHAWGTVEIVDDRARGRMILEDLIRQSDAAYLSQWAQVSEDYKQKLYKGIVPFSLNVTRLEAKEKLSQNKTIGEQQRIAAALAESSDGAVTEIAGCMNRRLGAE